MNARVFVDTNVLVYSRDASEPKKQAQALTWMKYLWETRAGRLSFQVLQEYYVAVVDKLDPGLDPESARGDVRSLMAWHPIHIDAPVVEGAWTNQDRHGLAWWDALIVSASQIAKCGYLLTEDLQDDQELDGVVVISPFRKSPLML